MGDNGEDLQEVAMVDVLIIGAGITGLIAAHALQAAGHAVLVLDKGRSTGGRLATRRVGAGLADHGAQFCTVRTPEFTAHMERWVADGIAYEWARGWSDGSVDANPPHDGHPRYAIRGGFNSLAGHLEQGVNVRVNVKVTRIDADGDGVRAHDEQGGTYQARTALLTPPVPQSLALLDAGETRLIEPDRTALERIVYEPCLCAMVLLEGDAALPEPGAIQRPNEPIAWIADNRRKGISPHQTVITLHMYGDGTRARYAEPDEALIPDFHDALAPYLGEARIVETQIKRWRYSIPTVLHPQRCLKADGLPLVFAGDAFGGARVEGAALSGMAAGDALRMLVGG